MSVKLKKIIYWVLTSLIAFVFVGSAFGKLTADLDALKIAEGFGLNAQTYSILGAIEIISVIHFYHAKKRNYRYVTFGSIYGRCNCYTFGTRSVDYCSLRNSNIFMDCSDLSFSGTEIKNFKIR